jgi:hypothetical protein
MSFIAEVRSFRQERGLSLQTDADPAAVIGNQRHNRSGFTTQLETLALHQQGLKPVLIAELSVTFASARL